MKKLQSEYANLYKSLCSSYGINHHKELKDERLKSFSSELKQKWQYVVAGDKKKEKKKKKKDLNKPQHLTIVMLQSWQRRLSKILNELYENQLIYGYNGDVGPTELTVLVNTRLTQDELLETLRNKLNFDGYLNIHKSTDSEMEEFL